MASDDDFPDEFGDIDFDRIPALASSSSDIARSNNQSTPPNASHASRQSTPGSSCFDDEEYDAAFLAEVDAIEDRAVSKPVRSPASCPDQPSSSNIYTSRFFSDPCANRSTVTQLKTRETANGKATARDGAEQKTLQKRVLSAHSSPIKKKVKSDVSEVLERFEEEVTCSICCDIFVAAHLGNPCGHTFCGECGWKWISRNVNAPTCAVCRSKLTRDVPMIPNLVVDNTVEKHIDALRSAGDAEWQPGGIKMKDWEARRARWKSVAVQRMQAGKPASPLVNIRRYSFRSRTVVAPWIPAYDDLARDPDYDEGEG